MTAAPRLSGPLFVDLYELTMAAAYFERRTLEPATFTLAIRACESRNYFVAAGLESVLRTLSAWRFTDAEIDYLRSTGYFRDPFLRYLADLRFSGEVWALPEGTVFFAEEPVLEVTAPIIEAQLIETFLLNTIGFETLVATKAARCRYAAGGRGLTDFALRRTQGVDAGLKVARNTYLAGFDATSNVLAGRLYGIPVAGTMAHSFVLAFDSELEAFQAYAETFPDDCTLLIDTYDTLTGAQHAATVATRMKATGCNLAGVRLDSGDMALLSRQVRAILDAAGLPDVQIVASSGFDEFKIAKVLAEGACIDAFGVGTKVGVSADAPYLDIVYKLADYGGRPVRKLSAGKRSLAGAKQVFRRVAPDGRGSEDVIALRAETVEGAQPLLEAVLRDGRPLAASPPLSVLRERVRRNLAALDARYLSLATVRPYPVRISRRLAALQKAK